MTDFLGIVIVTTRAGRRKESIDFICPSTKNNTVIRRHYDVYGTYIPNPNSCSSRIPITSRLNILANKWKMPACNQMQVISRQPSCLSTTLSTSRAPILSNLKKENKIKGLSILLVYLLLFQ